jgi:tRNA threonylcarbamoyladenosine biosynthesis protein TsaB
MFPVGMERVSKPSDVRLPDEWAAKQAEGVGRGFAAYTDLRVNLADQLTHIDDALLPGAREIATLAVPDVRAGRVHAPEAAIPVYIRNEVARPKAP